jgi:hypothetical protein
MGHLFSSVVLTSLTLATVRGGETQEAAPAKADSLAKIIRLTLEPPAGPVVLDRALSGTIPIRLWAENLSKEAVVLCRPVDGSMAGERDPRYVYRLIDGQGREVPRSKGDFCPWQNALQDRDFVTLKPKEKVDLLKGTGSFGLLTTYLFGDPGPGTYTLTLTYAMTGVGKVAGKPAGNPGRNVSTLLAKALRGQVTSSAVKVRFIPAPATEQLLKILDGTLRDGQEKVLGPADALLVVGYRRDEKGYGPALAALCAKDSEVRAAAAIALREYAAAYSVGQLNHKDIIPPELLESLSKAAADDSSYRVRSVAAISLRQAREMLEAAKGMK